MVLDKIEQHPNVFCERLKEEKHSCVEIRLRVLIHEFQMFRELSETKLKQYTSQGQVRVAFLEALVELGQ